jgi:2-keto-3-deoxy-L-rhamnonate aldolase RhmA
MGPNPALGYQALPLGEAIHTLNSETLVIVMIETRQASKRADEIAAVEGIDMLMIGSNDLCTELGIPGRSAPSEAARRVRVGGESLSCARQIARRRRHPRRRGAAEPARSGFGARFIIAGNDCVLPRGAARADVQALRKLG